MGRGRVYFIFNNHKGIEMTTAEAKEKAREMNESIHKIVKQYEENTGMTVDEIWIDRRETMNFSGTKMIVSVGTRISLSSLPA